MIIPHFYVNVYLLLCNIQQQYVQLGLLLGKLGRVLLSDIPIIMYRVNTQTNHIYTQLSALVQRTTTICTIWFAVGKAMLECCFSDQPIVIYRVNTHRIIPHFYTGVCLLWCSVQQQGLQLGSPEPVTALEQHRSENDSARKKNLSLVSVTKNL